MGFLSSIKDFFEEKINDLKDWYSSLSEEANEEELFDQEEEAEEIQEEIERLQDELDSLPEDEPGLTSEDVYADEIEGELGSIPNDEDFEIDYDDLGTIDKAQVSDYEGLDFPDWIDEDTQTKLQDDLGIYSYDDLTDAEKDEFIEGWRGFEDADEPASELIDEDLEKFRQDIQDELHIPDDIMSNLSDDELLRLAQISGDEQIGLGREFSELEPEDLADELDRDYRGSFETWEDFINSNLWDFIMERPDLFDIYVDEDGNIEIYESDVS